MKTGCPSHTQGKKPVLPKNRPPMNSPPTKTPPLLEARNLRKLFSGIAAVDDVSLVLAQGETLAIVGESGSGKTTLARILLRLIEPDSGEVLIEGRNFLAVRGGVLRALRREMQMVFQDPFTSLDPRMRVGAIVG